MTHLTIFKFYTFHYKIFNMLLLAYKCVCVYFMSESSSFKSWDQGRSSKTAAISWSTYDVWNSLIQLNQERGKNMTHVSKSLLWPRKYCFWHCWPWECLQFIPTPVASSTLSRFPILPLPQRTNSPPSPLLPFLLSTTQGYTYKPYSATKHYVY